MAALVAERHPGREGIRLGGASALPSSNTFPSLPLIDPQTLEFEMNVDGLVSSGGLGGPAILPLSMAKMAQLTQAFPDKSFSGIGGVAEFAHALNYFLLGCGTVLFQFGLAPMINSADGWSVQTLTLIGLSLALALGGITKVSYIGDGPVDRVALRLIGATGLVGAGVALLAIAGGVRSSVPAQSILMPLAPMAVAMQELNALHDVVADLARPAKPHAAVPTSGPMADMLKKLFKGD